MRTLLAAVLLLVAVSQADDDLGSFFKPIEANEDKPAPVVKAPAGDFEGFWKQTHSGRPLASFEGIPFAKPPVGELRFKPAQKLERLVNFKALKLGPVCMQRQTAASDETIRGNENCLYLNVYVPETTNYSKNERLPVMFWVHGGALVEGGAFTEPAYLLDKNIVFVSCSYRLGPLGFLTTEDSVIPGNLGLKDQVAALQWVHDNIASFGGDPNLVTVFGHSAGGESTEFLMMSPLTKGLIHRAIAMSGSALSPMCLSPPGQAKEYRTKVAVNLNCPPEPSQALLECLQQKPASEIIASDFIFKKFPGTLLIPFKPTVEGDVPGAFLPYHPLKMYEEGLFNDIPFTTGIVSKEGYFISVGIFTNKDLVSELDAKFLEVAPDILFLPGRPNEAFEDVRKFYFGTGPLASTKEHLLNASDLFTDNLFLWPMMLAERSRRRRAKSPTFVYYYTYEGHRYFGNLPGATHGDDQFYLFPGSAELSKNDTTMVDAMTDLYSNFARNGIPTTNAINLKWDSVTTNGTYIEYLELAGIENSTMKKDLLPERWGLWEKEFGSPEKQ